MKKLSLPLLFIVFFLAVQIGFAQRAEINVNTAVAGNIPRVKTELNAAAPLNDEVTGTTAGGAHFKIIKPDGWDGGSLVIWNHGFSLDPVGVVSDMGPLVDIHLAEGYAVAASSYRQSGWALFNTTADLENLYNEFVANFGVPGEVIVYGGSLGGIVTAQALEQANIGNVTGAYSICGALAGSRNWDGALDARLVYDVVAADVAGGSIPGGAEGLPAGSNFSELNFLLAVNATTGVSLSAAERTAEQQANLDQILNETQLPENFLLTTLGYGTFALSDLTHDAAKLDGRVGVGNINIVYSDTEINDNIERVAPDPSANYRLGQYFTPAGDVGNAKIIAIHTDKDGLVIVENMSEYAAVVPAANLTQAIVVENEATHCGFTEAEVLAGWEALRGWIGGLPQPTAVALQTACEGLVGGGLADGPCRIDPSFIVPDMDERVRPRLRWQALFLPIVQRN